MQQTGREPPSRSSRRRRLQQWRGLAHGNSSQRSMTADGWIRRSAQNASSYSLAGRGDRRRKQTWQLGRAPRSAVPVDRLASRATCNVRRGTLWNACTTWISDKFYLRTDSSDTASTTPADSIASLSYPSSPIRSSCVKTKRLKIQQRLLSIVSRWHRWPFVAHQWACTTISPAAIIIFTRWTTGFVCSSAIICLSNLTCCCHCGGGVDGLLAAIWFGVIKSMAITGTGSLLADSCRISSTRKSSSDSSFSVGVSCWT